MFLQKMITRSVRVYARNKYELNVHKYNDKQAKTYTRNMLCSSMDTLTENKVKYISALNGTKPIVICTGPTGSGKTFLACREGVRQLNKYKKILITRPAVSIENEEHGFLPGTLEQKMTPWFRPIYDNIEDSFGKDYLEYLIRERIIEICPFAYMRGRTFNNTLIIADEMQNTTKMQFKTLLTRIGNNSKIVINGDSAQSDVNDDGLADFIFRMKKYRYKRTLVYHGSTNFNDMIYQGNISSPVTELAYQDKELAYQDKELEYQGSSGELEYQGSSGELEYISHIELDSSDIMRHPSVAEVLKIYS
jgi:phosphate starvation-inducible protein PhoH